MVLLRTCFNGAARASAFLKFLFFEERKQPGFLEEVTSNSKEEN